MKSYILIILLFISLSIIAQNNTDYLKSIDTIQLTNFNPTALVSFEFRDAKISISKKEFLQELYKHRKDFLDSISRKEPDNPYSYHNNALKTIDSINNFVLRNENLKDVIISLNRTCSQIGIDLFMRFDKFIDNSRCKIFDKNGIKQNIIIRKTMVEYWVII